MPSDNEELVEYDDFNCHDDIIDDNTEYFENVRIPHTSFPWPLRLALEELESKTSSAKVKLLATTEVSKSRYLNMLKKLQEHGKIDIGESDYQDIITLGLFLEEYESEKELEPYTCKVKVTQIGGLHLNLLPKNSRRGQKCTFRVEYSNKNLDPPVQKKDRVIIFEDDKRFELTVDRVCTDYLLVSAKDDNRFITSFPQMTSFTIKFLLNTYPFDCSFFALKRLRMGNLGKRLFPEEENQLTDKMSSTSYSTEDIEWFNEKIASNPEQSNAVVQILNKSSFPVPYIIFGPPGTGKTTTIVEAMLQILKITKSELTEDSEKILVCTPSNSAANTIFNKLVDFGFQEDVVRLYSNSAKSLPTISGDSSDSDSSEHPDTYNFSRMPSKHEGLSIKRMIKEKRIVICTLCYCSKLVCHKVANFNYIFIDEAGQATEPDALIPFNINDTAHIVLSGDPLQLGPVIKSKLAEPILGTSLLERLMSRDVYKKDRSYSQTCLVQLLNNYRSHPAIISLSNELFYRNALKTLGSDVVKIDPPNFIPDMNFPVIFHKCVGKEQKTEHSQSAYNIEELNVAVQYVRRLLSMKLNGRQIQPDNIGIITLFSLQNKKVQQKLKREKIVGVEVGTVELFQGREKDIIILSSVRSKVFTLNGVFTKHIGFLQNPKRLNVAMTRAKQLMIVIGDPDVLKIDRHWLHIVNVCLEKNSIKGESMTQEKIRQPRYCLDPTEKKKSLSSNDFYLYAPSLLEQTANLSI